MTNNENYGCLALLFGLRNSKSDPTRGEIQTMTEGDIHSGPGGYEGMGYSGGYAEDYFEQSGEHSES
ncbi:MAG: hypothetical protein RL228_366 [Actinomycetota bacterium]|jgi:hypothetical protein